MNVYWKEVAEPDGIYHKRLNRIEVPGGWIYKSDGDGMCFVPAPVIYANVNTGYAQFKPKIIDVKFKEAKE